jgi:RecA/RadA recombinase
MQQLRREEQASQSEEENDDLVEDDEGYAYDNPPASVPKSQIGSSSFQENIDMLLAHASQKEEEKIYSQNVTSEEELSSLRSHDSETSQDVFSLSDEAFDTRGSMKIETAIDYLNEDGVPYPFAPLVLENMQQVFPYPSKDELIRAFTFLKVFNLENFIHQFNRVDPHGGMFLGKLNERGGRKYLSQHVDRITHDLSTMILPRMILNCSTLLQRTRELASVLSTGSNVLDFALNGGFKTRCVSEIAGESSAGKTQFAVQLLIQSVLPRKLGGLEGQALYICSEGYPKDRMLQLAEHKLKQIKRCVQEYNHRASKREIGETDEEFDEATIRALEEFQIVADIMDRIKVTEVKNHEIFQTLVTKTVPSVCRMMKNIRCIIIDSLAALFRGESEFSSREGYMKRTNYLFEMANHLKIVADQHNCAVIVINQVTSVIKDAAPRIMSVQDHYVSPITAIESKLYMWGTGDDDEEDPRQLMRTAQIMNKKIIPSLGLAWSNCVNVSVMLTRTEIPVRVNTVQNGAKRQKTGHQVVYLTPEGDQALDEREVSRQMHVIFAPHVKSNSVAYVVRESGVEGVE